MFVMTLTLSRTAKCPILRQCRPNGASQANHTATCSTPSPKTKAWHSHRTTDPMSLGWVWGGCNRTWDRHHQWPRPYRRIPPIPVKVCPTSDSHTLCRMDLIASRDSSQCSRWVVRRTYHHSLLGKCPSRHPCHTMGRVSTPKAHQHTTDTCLANMYSPQMPNVMQGAPMPNMVSPGVPPRGNNQGLPHMQGKGPPQMYYQQHGKSHMSE